MTELCGVTLAGPILNGSGTLADQSVYRPIWDDLAATLAAYPAGPSPADLQPR